MVVWLVGKSIADLTITPVSKPEGRWHLAPNPDNQLYTIGELQFHYLLQNGAPGQRMSIANCYGRISKPIHIFSDRSKKLQQLEYWQIELWDVIPEAWRDVVFYHEFTELEALARGEKFPATHEHAVQKTDEYLAKFLSADERAAFGEAMRTLRTRR